MNAALRASGRLVIVGGGEEKSGDRVVLRRFAELAGGPDARIVVIGTATTEPDAAERNYLEAFDDLCNECRFFAIGSRDEANDPGVLSELSKATGVFFSGGDQRRIAQIFGGSEADVALHLAFLDGVVIGGTSAGAAVMSSTMILGGQEEVPTMNSVTLGPGLEFVGGMLIDMHFAQRGRLARLLGAVAQFPHQLGVGIDENTAMVVEGNRIEIIGAGAVTIVDAGQAWTEVHEDGPIGMTGVRLHVLPAGFAFDLANREPVAMTKGGLDDVPAA